MNYNEPGFMKKPHPHLQDTTIIAATETIESIILSNDRRNISALRPFLPADFCVQAAQRIVETRGPVFIVSGFYIPAAGMPETDGPPGALAIGRSLRSLGREVSFIADPFSKPVFEKFAPAGCDVLDFPLLGHTESRETAAQLLKSYQPGLLISVERCALTPEMVYRNFRGKDISAYNARVDYLFDGSVPSIGVGDGGNEIGMGNLAEIIPSFPGMPPEGVITRTTHLVISSVSNWGSYGLLAALTHLTGQDVLPTVDDEATILRAIVDFGVVDGTTGKQEYQVDGFSLEENMAVLERLHQWVKSQASSS